jgi:hypothetical protein
MIFFITMFIEQAFAPILSQLNSVYIVISQFPCLYIHVPPKIRQTSNKLHSLTSQKTAVITAARISNLASWLNCAVSTVHVALKMKRLLRIKNWLSRIWRYYRNIRMRQENRNKLCHNRRFLSWEQKWLTIGTLPWVNFLGKLERMWFQFRIEVAYSVKCKFFKSRVWSRKNSCL